MPNNFIAGENHSHVAKKALGEMQWVKCLYMLPGDQQPMLTTALNPSAELAVKLLLHYSFDLSGYSASELITIWQREYPISWLHLAVIEALYQGRYKAISVQQILIFWTRRDQAAYHFNMEFERMICSKFPERLNFLSLAVLPPSQKNSSIQTKSNPAIARIGEYSTTSDKAQQHAGEDSSSDVSTSPSFKISSESTAKQLAVISSQNQKQLMPQNSRSLSAFPVSQMLLASSNHPPIGQFTPETSDRSELFTSKLKAMVSA